MSSHIKKQKTIFGQNQYFSPGRPGTYNPGFSLLRLKRTTTTLETKKTELFILLLEGEITIALDESPETYTFKRSSIFKDLPSGLYVPPGKKVTIQSLRELSEAALCFSSELQRGTNDGNALQPMACRSGDVVVRDVGQGSYRRKVMTTCGAKGETRTLLVGETLSEGGMWSSYPPHRHEKNELPMENKLKEIYYYRIDPPQGFAFQGLYSDVSAAESAFMVRDGDAVFISNGYHPVAAAPGYLLYYLWVLCGQVPETAWKVDDKHKWIDRKKE